MVCWVFLSWVWLFSWCLLCRWVNLWKLVLKMVFRFFILWLWFVVVLYSLFRLVLD